jgi:hypothetical protein
MYIKAKVLQPNGTYKVEEVDESERKDIRVTDWKYTDRKGRDHVGYPMNRYLYENIKEIPAFLKRRHYMTMIVTGNGEMQVGKSTFACQVGFLVSFILKGGKLDDNGHVLRQPDEPPEVHIHFNTKTLGEDIANETRQNQVYILDESDQACGSRTYGSSSGKEFHDLQTRTAYKHNFLILCLPSFFRLAESYACDETHFLCNVYSVGGKRGFFDFFNKDRKENLFTWGKKRKGGNKYKATWPNFWGRFADVFVGMPIKEYLNQKAASVLELGKATNKIAAVQRDAVIKKMYEKTKLSYTELAKELNLPYAIVNAAIVRANKRQALQQAIDTYKKADFDKKQLENQIDNIDDITIHESPDDSNNESCNILDDINKQMELEKKHDEEHSDEQYDQPLEDKEEYSIKKTEDEQ